ncbi:Ig domain-containing protein [Streptomyces sp. NPDC096097]|uniref:Ig domain-containing protein n=1 Tax=Streptomyces sp. NPDC096097 TaxID=3155546 RepID=UPI00331C307C
MGVETFLRNPQTSYGSVEVTSAQQPGSFSVSTQLMQDAVPAQGVLVGDGRNQEALFANPFKSGREEALVIKRQGQLTYLERTESSSTGWVQGLVEGTPAVAEVVTVVHPSGDVWAICSPKDTSADVFGLVLKAATSGGAGRCVWQGMTSYAKPGIAAQALLVSYAPDGGALVVGTSLDAPGEHTNFVLTPRLETITGTASGWAVFPSRIQAAGYPVVGAGYLPYFSAGGQAYTFVYYLLQGQKLTRWEERLGEPPRGPLDIPNPCTQFCGSYHQPYLNRENPQGDIGYLFVDKGGWLEWGYYTPGSGLIADGIRNPGFEAKCRLWQDADGRMHLFGLDENGSLQVLHQTGWETVLYSGSPDANRLRPKWTRARVAAEASGIGGYDLARPNDRMVAFDYSGSGKSDHLFAYRPGPTHYYSDQTVWVVERTQELGGFAEAFSSPSGLPGYDFTSPDDRVVAYDYTASGSADHLLAYRPGAGKFSIFKKQDGTGGFVTVAGASSGGIGGKDGTYDLADARDRLLPFDYLGNNRNDHLLAYRPGTGTAWVLAPHGDGSFTPVVRSSTGMGGFTLNNPADQIVGLDFDSSGSSTHLLAYRPGTGMAYILVPDRQGGFSAVVANNSGGIGGYDLSRPNDRLLPFDYTGLGKNNHLLAYRPGPNVSVGDQTVWILQRQEAADPYKVIKQYRGLGGYDFSSSSDLVIGYDYNGTGGLTYLVPYRPGAGKVSVMSELGGEIVPIYQVPPAAPITVTVGLHADVVDYQLDPYPDYKPSQLIKMSGMQPAEAYCVCTQDITTSQWQMDKIRLPEPPKAPGETAPPPDVVSHYTADVALLSNVGQAMNNHPVSVSADSLVEVQIEQISYQVGPGRPIAVTTNPLGKLTLAVAARGLNPPVVHLNADGLQSGTAIDFAAQANDFLAGRSTLPSQNGSFTPDLLEHAKVHSNMSPLNAEDDDLADWPALKERGLTPQVVVDHCTNMYGQAAGNKQLQPARLDGFDDPQPIFGYVIQMWDPDRPAYQAFRSQEELDAYKAYRNDHPSYGGWWDDFTNWAADVWEGIKTGAAKIAEVIVTAVVEIAIWVGDAIVSLGEMVIDVIERAIEAVEAVFQMIADAIMRVIDWLKSLFALGAIWNTKEALEGAIIAYAPLFSSTIEHVGTQVGTWLLDAKKKFNDTLDTLLREYSGTRLGDFGNKVPAAAGPTGTQINTEEFNTPQANWMYNKGFSGNAAYCFQIQERPTTVLDEELVEKLTAFFGTLSSDAQGMFSKLEKLFADVASFCTVDAGAGAGSSTFESMIDMLRTLVDAVIDAITAVAEVAFAAAAAAAASFWELFSEPLVTPFGLLEALYEWVHHQARPNEPPETLTLGRLVLAVTAFFMTVIYKLINGVDQEPFPQAKFPEIPLPSWDSRRVADADQESTSIPDWKLNSDMLWIQRVVAPACAFFGGVSTGITDWLGLPENVNVAAQQRGLNGISCFATALTLLTTAPPVLSGKEGWDQKDNDAAWGLQVVRLGLDIGFSARGHLCKFMKRSAVLKNVGATVKEIHHIWEGSAAHFVLGGCSMGCGIAGAIKYPPGSKVLAELALSSSVLGSVPDVIQGFRAIARKVSPTSNATRYICMAVAVIDLLSVAASDLLIGVPANIEGNTTPPTIDKANPPDATVDTKYEHTFTGTGPTLPINSPAMFYFDNLPAWLTIKDTATGLISGTPASTDEGKKTFTVAISDGFSPPQGESHDFTLAVVKKATPDA